MNVFTENAGRFLDPQEANSMTGAYRTRKAAAGISEDDCVRSEYFGINQVMQLLGQTGCIGLRIHHAKRWEDAEGNPIEEGKGQLKPRVLLTGVDSAGKDMPDMLAKSGLKDDGDGDAQTVGDGYTCPQHCPK